MTDKGYQDASIAIEAINRLSQQMTYYQSELDDRSMEIVDLKAEISELISKNKGLQDIVAQYVARDKMIEAEKGD